MRSHLEWLFRITLLAVLLASMVLWGRGRAIYFLGSDDLILLGRSRDVVSGNWHRLFEAQGPHVIPLFSLVRMYFDLHFPDRYDWMHYVVMAAHLTSTALVFALSKRYLEKEAALCAATLFTWQGLGGEAMFIRSQTTFVLSLPFLLGALHCISRPCAAPTYRWAVGCLVYLLIAVGLHSLAAAAAIPGILLGYYLLGRTGPRNHATDRLAWAACTVPFLLAWAVWLHWGLPSLSEIESGEVRFIKDQFVARLRNAVYGTALLFAYMVRRLQPTPPVLLAAVVGLIALLLLLRNQPAWRWIVSALSLTTGPALLAFLLRTSWSFSNSRYAYQSFLAVAVTAGGALNLVLVATRRWPIVRTGALAILFAVAAPFYYRSQHVRLDQTVAQLVHWHRRRACAKTTGSAGGASLSRFRRLGPQRPG